MFHVHVADNLRVNSLESHRFYQPHLTFFCKSHCIEESVLLIVMLVQILWDGLRDRVVGTAQVFYKERAALGYIALEPQLTVLICTGSSLLSALWQPAVALTLINPVTVPAP